MLVVSDEIHQDLVYGENSHIPSLSVGDYDHMMISLTAPSKTFNIAGAQNSIVVIPDEELRKKWDRYIEEIAFLMEMPLDMWRPRRPMKEEQDG